MRIAFFHELPKGGAQIAVNEIAEGLRKRHKVDLYYTDESESQEGIKNYKNVYFFKFVPLKWTGKNFKTRIQKDTLELAKLSRLHKKIAQVIDKGNYDLVFVNASKYIESPFILKYLKTSKVFYLHDPHFRMIYEKLAGIPINLDPIRSTYEKIHRKMLKVLDKQNLSHADLLIANSMYTQKKTFKSYGMKSEVAYLGVDTNFFLPTRKKTKPIDVLYIGSKDPLDGYEILNNSLKHLKHLNVRTVFKERDWFSREKILDLYRHTKVVVCLGRDEPFGLIPLEAAACGVSVIALNEGGYPETVVNSKSGYLISGNPKKLAEKISYLISHPKTRERFGKFARKNSIELWDWKKRIIDLESILKSL